jgi:2-methylcitrate dehydratase PrpD
MNVDAGINVMYPDKTATRLEVRMNDGETFQRQIDTPLGDPRAPMEALHIKNKLASYAACMNPETLGRITGMILDLEKLDGIEELTALIKGV